MRAVNQSENLELNPSKEWEPMRKVKHKDRGGGCTRKSGNQSNSSNV